MSKSDFSENCSRYERILEDRIIYKGVSEERKEIVAIGKELIADALAFDLAEDV